jgi:hypothetical protein
MGAEWERVIWTPHNIVSCLVDKLARKKKE